MAELRSWEKFTTTLDPTAPTKQHKVWGVMRALDGRARAPIPDQPIRLHRPGHLRPRLAVSDRQKADAAALHFREVSTLKIPQTLSRQCKQQIKAHIKSGHMPAAAAPFSDAELRAALFPKGKKGKAAGPDGLFPVQLKELSEFGRSKLLELLNRAWELVRVPASWKLAWVVPILKKGKDPQQIASYRPVSLLSVLSRTIETMMRIRMNYWAEACDLIPQEQSGFRAGRSTTDAIIATAQRAFDGLNTPLCRRVGATTTYPQRSYLMLLDIKGAYDRIYRDGLLAKLAGMDIPSHWLRWLQAWLSDRRLAVRWNNSLSKSRTIKQGVPQGSGLSVELAKLAWADLPDRIKAAVPDAEVCNFADDFAVRTSGRTANIAAEKAQRAADAVARWAEETLTTIAVNKCAVLVITLDPAEQGRDANEIGRLRRSSSMARKFLSKTTLSFWG